VAGNGNRSSSQKKAVKFRELKAGGWWQTWDVEELLWDFHYPVKVSLYADKKKTRSLGSTSASLVFEQAEKAKLEEAKALVAKQWRVMKRTWVTLSGWPEKVLPVAAESGPEIDQTAAATPPAKEQRSVREGKPPFEWDWKNSCAQCTLTFEEPRRLKIPGMPTKGTTVVIDFRATGFSAEEELSLWRKVQDGSYTEFPVALTPEGVLRMPDKGAPDRRVQAGRPKRPKEVLSTSFLFGGFVLGEALQMAVHSNTTGKSAFAKVILFPIEAQAAGGCAAAAELLSPDGYAFVITFRGFTPGEEVEVVSLYKKEKIPHALKASERGELSQYVMFGPGDKGKARISAKGKACQVSLEYKVGKDALVVQ